MENDLISRAAALQALRQLCDMTDDNIAIMPDVAAVLRELPAADAVQVRHGRWTKAYRSGMLVKTGCVSSCCDMWAGRQSDYCPSCGARMDEEAPK